MNSITRLFPLLALPALLMLAPRAVLADEDCTSGACFPMTATVGDSELPLRSTHLFRYWGFRVYSAAIYIGREVGKGDDVLVETPMRLVLHYHRTIEPSNMIEGAEKVMPRDPENDMEALRDRLDRVNAAYEEVSRGDEYAVTYEPGVGLTIALNGEDQVTVEGFDFARAYFGIWLGPRPISDSLRQALLDFDD